MKKIKQHYPRRGAMLKTAFQPLSDDEFRAFVATGVAIPGQQGASLFVTKWRDGPGLGADAFLETLRAQGSTLEVRRFESDINIRVIRHQTSVGKRSLPARG
ncbi:MAG: hypothetical protein WBF81_01250 [Thermoplasmata archaeon]